jgi:hypothetical protein
LVSGRRRLREVERKRKERINMVRDQRRRRENERERRESAE